MQYYTFLYNTIRYIHYNSRNTKQYDTCVCKMPSFVYLVKCLLLHLPSKRRKCSATLFRAASLCRAWKKVENQNGGQDKDEFTRPGRLAHRKSQFHSPGPRQKLQKSIYQLHNNKGLKCIHLTPRILPIRKVPVEQGDPSLHMGEDPNQPLGHFQFYQN